MDKLEKIKDVLYHSYMLGDNGNEMTIDEIIDNLLENPAEYKDMRNDIIEIIKILLEK